MDGEREKKRVCRGDDGDGGVNGGCWEDLSPEILALIFVRIPADELVRVVSFVCKSWREVVAGPYCWSDIDLEQWCRRCNHSDRIDFAVSKLIRRSKGTCCRLSAYKLSDFGFSFVANCGSCLKVLQVPMSTVTDKIIEVHAESLANLTFLDISYCLKITSKGLEVLGKSCKSLIHLRRNMPPPEWGQTSEAMNVKADDGEVMAIANTMPRLHHLELGHGRFSDLGLNAILTKCKDLAHLDIQGCWNVKVEGDLEDKCDQLLEFKGPWYHDYDEDTDDDDEDSFSGSD